MDTPGLREREKTLQPEDQEHEAGPPLRVVSTRSSLFFGGMVEGLILCSFVRHRSFGESAPDATQ